MAIRISLVLLPLFFLAPFIEQCYAQGYLMNHYAMDKGLPSNKVYDVYRDSKGYLWFGTDKGAARYNGIVFEKFTTFNGLPDNEVFFFKEDYQHRLWIGTYGGDLCYYKDGIFHTAVNTPFLKLPFTVSPHTRGVTIEKDSSVTMIFEDRAKFINIINDEIKIYSLNKIDNALNVNGVIHINKISKSNYRLFLAERLIEIDTLGNVLTSKYWQNNKDYIYHFAEDKEFLLSKNGIYDLNESLLYKLNIPDDVIKNTLRLNLLDQHCFLCTRDGLIDNHERLLDGKFTTCIAKDIAGNYWVSTLGDGVYCLKSNRPGVKQYPFSYRGTVRTSFSHKNKLYFINSYGELYGWNDSALALVASPHAGKFAKPCNWMATLVDDSFDYYHFCDRENWLIHSALTNQTSQKLKNSSVTLFKDIRVNDRYIYGIGNNNVFSLGKDAIKSNSTVPVHLLNHDGQHIFANAQDRNGDIWFSTVNNIYKIFKQEVRSQTQFKGVAFRDFTFLGGYLIGYTRNNNLLICANYDNAHVVIDTVPEQNSIWERIYRIDSFHLLISTNNSYRLLTITSGDKGRRFEIANVENSFIPIEAESIVTIGDVCYFFKGGAVSCFNKEDLFEQAARPRIYFTGLVAGSKNYAISADIAIPHSESDNISLMFSAVSFNSLSQIDEYSVGTDNGDNWQLLTGNQINLISPGYGVYIVKIRCKTLSSDYSQVATLKFTVLRPFWAKWWFIALLTVLILVLVAVMILFVLKRVVRRRQKEHESDMKFQQSEFKALNALMNPHFIFNSLNNIQSLVNQNEKKVANEYLSIFSRLVRQNMQNISNEFISLQMEINLIENYLKLEKLRFKDLVNYKFEVDDDIDADMIKIPPLLIQPLVENAVKHGLLPKQSTSAMVRIHIFEEGDVLKIEVIDNGVGLSASLAGKDPLYVSYGLEILEKRINHLTVLHKKESYFKIEELYDLAGNTMGTKAAISIQIT